MNAIDIDKLKQLISRTDISGNDKVRWLTDFIDGRELQQQQGFSEEVKCSEVRMIVSPFMLQTLITELQLHQKKLNNITKNADQLSSLVKHITSEEE